MSKKSRQFKCSQCHARQPKWSGQCSGCSAWNTLSEVVHEMPGPTGGAHATRPTQSTLLKNVATQSTSRMCTGITEWDRLCGDGIMPGSFTMLTGDPGIGKSTLMLHVAERLSRRGYRVMYVSSEESLEQVRLRAERLQCLEAPISFLDSPDLDTALATAEHEHPHIVLLDSIQNTHTRDAGVQGTAPGLRDATFRLMRFAKFHTIAVLASGHITKDGTMAGPKTLEHMVDTVLYLQSDDKWQTRILRSVKNRFGSVNDAGFFSMESDGLHEMRDVNKTLLTDISSYPGSALTSYTEGTRSLIVELQALTIPSTYGVPQRVISGIEQKQVVLIAAILEKCLNVKLNAHDLFFKVSGGIKITGSGCDLAIACALLSSFFQKPLTYASLALGEISLTGAVKPITPIAHHLKEAETFGITHVYLAEQQTSTTTCTPHYISHVRDLLDLFT